jgi:signal transduction histidine kinase/CheY-like chemotaxis protein
MDLNPEQLERLLLMQLRRGHPHLRFSSKLEPIFFRDRFRYMQAHWGLMLVMVAAVLFQLVYAVYDMLAMPLGTALALLPLRLVCIVAALASCLYFRRRDSDPWKAYSLFGLSYLTCGICVVLLTYLGRYLGQPTSYEGLVLLLLFGYGLVNLPFTAVTLGGWVLFLLYAGLGMLWPTPIEALPHQLLFLACVNLIGSAGTYVQEHAHRSGWINLKLLNIARRRMQSDTQGKLRMLTAVSHDLRQPLNAMGLYAQHLHECATEPEVRHISGRLNESVAQLGRMLQSLLEYNRLTLSGGVSVQLQSLELRPLLSRLCAETQTESLQQVTLNCAEGLWVRSDPVLLERLLRNLLNNALRHAQAEHVWLHAERGEDEVRLEVGDDGCGMSGEDQEGVFEEFRQLNNPGRHTDQGLGLGLAIVRQMALLLGHALQLESSPGQGARFYLHVPQAEQIPVQPVAAEVYFSGRILLLEDDLASRDALQALLQRWGCEVRACADLQTALGCIDEVQPHLLISDFRLGAEEDGVMAIERLRERFGQMLPALLVSADTNPELQRRCMLLNINLQGKPLLPVRLRQALSLLLAPSRVALS